MQSNSPPLTKEQIQVDYRRLNAKRHPLLRQLSRDDIYDGGNGMAPGGLILAEMLADELSIKPGDKVLDLGCGRGQSSVFLASRYQVEVTSVDLWIGAEERKRRAADAGGASGSKRRPMECPAHPRAHECARDRRRW